MRARRTIASLLSVAIVVGGLSACSREEQGSDEVQRAIDATRLEALKFVYTVSTPEAGAFQVQGLVEDDFRYKARLLRASKPVFDEVVKDDAIAVRFAQPDLLGAFIDDGQRRVAELETDLNGVTVVDALGAKRWVLDGAGAPSPTDPARAVNNIGKDPVFDALGIFAYVEQAMAQAFEVHEWSADDLDPAYRSSEDVFPRPDEDSGVKRFDLRRPWLPPIGISSGQSADALPATKHFRKMAIYIKDGRIIQVLERVEVTGKALEDFLRYAREFSREQGATDEQIEAAERELEDMSDTEKSDFLLSTLSLGLDAAGADPIAVRTMTFDLQDVGSGDITAELPDDVIHGSLAILLNRGAKAEEAQPAAGQPAAPATSQSTASDDG